MTSSGLKGGEEGGEISRAGDTGGDKTPEGDRGGDREDEGVEMPLVSNDKDTGCDLARGERGVGDLNIRVLEGDEQGEGGERASNVVGEVDGSEVSLDFTDLKVEFGLKV